MAGKQYQLTDDLTVTVYKRRNNRSIRLTLAANGLVRVSIPAWAPYRSGYEFAKARMQWILEQKPAVGTLKHDQQIGRAHRLVFKPGNTQTSTAKINQTEIIVRHPINHHPGSSAVQAAASRGAIKALRLQSEQLLPQRLKNLAEANGYQFRTVKVKQLSGRWGSCDVNQNIVLNLFLMQLPWELIDYVLVHELAHTKVLRHGKDFWDEVAQVLPNYKVLRSQLKSHQPILT